MPNQKIAVVGVVEYQDKVLVGKKVEKQHELSNAWHIPGGKMDETDATPEAAMVREIMEEARISIEVVRLLDKFEVPGKNVLVKWFLCKANTDQVVAGDDLVEAKFVSKSQLRAVCDPKAIALWPSKVVEYLGGEK